MLEDETKKNPSYRKQGSALLSCWKEHAGTYVVVVNAFVYDSLVYDYVVCCDRLCTVNGIVMPPKKKNQHNSQTYLQTAIQPFLIPSSLTEERE